MAVALVNNYGGTAVDDNITHTISSVAITSGHFLLVFVPFRQSASQTVDGVTFNGSGTGIARHGSLEVGEGIAIDIWRGIGLSGTANVVVTLTGGAVACPSAHVLSGVDTGGTPLGTATFNSGENAGSIATAAVTADANALVLSTIFLRNDVATSLAPDGAQTQLTEFSDGFNDTSGGTSSEPGAASVTCSYTWTGTVQAAMRTVPILAAEGAAPSKTGRLLLTGIG